MKATGQLFPLLKGDEKRIAEALYDYEEVFTTLSYRKDYGFVCEYEDEKAFRSVLNAISIYVGDGSVIYVDNGERIYEMDEWWRVGYAHYEFVTMD